MTILVRHKLRKKFVFKHFLCVRGNQQKHVELNANRKSQLRKASRSYTTPLYQILRDDKLAKLSL